MRIFDSRIVITGVLFVLSYIFGIWLSKLGKPYNVVIFTFHKIIGVLTIIFTAITIYNLQKPVEISTVEQGIIVATGILIVVVFVSGGLLSIGKPANDLMLPVHKISSILTIITTAVIVYILKSGK